MAESERNGLTLDWSRAVTVDWDKPAPPEFSKFRGDARVAYTRATRVWVRQSGTKGFHIVLYFGRSGRRVSNEVPLPREIKFKARQALGDDRARLSFDKQRYAAAGRGSTSHRRLFRGDYATGVIFDVKDGNEAGPWRRVK